MTFIRTEYEVRCFAKDGCGLLGEHLSARDSDLLTAKHVRTTKHPTMQTGVPVVQQKEKVS